MKGGNEALRAIESGQHVVLKELDKLWEGGPVVVHRRELPHLAKINIFISFYISY